jgi:hypothetical protein
MLTMIFTIIGVPALAEEIAENLDPAVTDVVEESPTFLDRIVESIDRGDVYELIKFAFAGITLVVAWLLKKWIAAFVDKMRQLFTNLFKRLDENESTTKASLIEQTAAVSELLKSGTAVVEASRDDIERFKNEIRAEISDTVETVLSEIKADAAETRKAEIMLANVAKILDTVYSGSSTIPSVIKEKIAGISVQTESLLNAEEEAK